MLKKISVLFFSMLLAFGFIANTPVGFSLSIKAGAEASFTLTTAEIDSFVQNYKAHGKTVLFNSPSNTKATGKVTIRDIQILLNFIGNYGLTASGTYDTKTKNAVGDYQKSKGITKNFRVDENTFNSIISDARQKANGTLSDNFAFNGLNLSAADDYAKTYYKNYNTNEYQKYKADDANFVSQILIAAGVPETDYFHSSLSKGEPTLSAMNISSLLQYFRSVYGVKYYNNTKKMETGAVDRDTYLSRSGMYSYEGNIKAGCDEKKFTIDDIAAGDCVTINGTYLLYRNRRDFW